MSWIDFLWPLLTGACLTLALINLRLGLSGAPRAPHLWFSANAFSVALVSGVELALMHTTSVKEYFFYLFCGNVAVWMILASVSGFIWVFFRTGNKWLALAGPCMHALGLFSWVVPGGTGPAYLRINGLTRAETFGGATFQVAEGMPSLWNLVTYGAVVLVLVFVADASVRLWRQGGRRRAVIVGGSLTFFLIAAGTHSALIEVDGWHSPYLISWSYLSILMAMSQELTRDVCAAAELSHQLRESQERMNLAAEAAELGLWVWDIERDTIWSTDKGRELFGFAATESVSFGLFIERLHPDDRAPVRSAVTAAIANRSDYYNEHRVLSGTAPLRWIAARGRIEFSEDHRPLRMRGVSIDITPRKRVEVELQERRGELAHLSRVTMLGELSGSLAHELNQPLTAILSNAQAAQRYLAMESPDLAEVRDILADIVSEDERAGEVIRRLRLLFKKGEVQHLALDANEVVLEVLKLMRGDLVSQGVIVHAELAPNLAPILGDRVQLQQVLLNLVMNACDAMAENHPGCRRLTVRTLTTPAAGLRMEVSDSGRGLPVADPERVFERYYSTKPHGLGLGLSVCRTIIAAHDGTLTAEKNAERGATFICILGGLPTS